MFAAHSQLLSCFSFPFKIKLKSIWLRWELSFRDSRRKRAKDVVTAELQSWTRSSALVGLEAERYPSACAWQEGGRNIPTHVVNGRHGAACEGGKTRNHVFLCFAWSSLFSRETWWQSHGLARWEAVREMALNEHYPWLAWQLQISLGRSDFSVPGSSYKTQRVFLRCWVGQSPLKGTAFWDAPSTQHPCQARSSLPRGATVSNRWDGFAHSQNRVLQPRGEAVSPPQKGATRY